MESRCLQGMLKNLRTNLEEQDPEHIRELTQFIIANIWIEKNGFRKLIQGQVFTDERHMDLDSSPQPCPVPVLKTTLPKLIESQGLNPTSVCSIQISSTPSLIIKPVGNTIFRGFQYPWHKFNLILNSRIKR